MMITKLLQLSIHLSEYYNSINQKDSAKYYAYAAKNYAANFHNDDYLKTLLHLSKIEEDSLAVNYYKEYITLNDSLISNERAIRNKFARIRYETKEIEQRNETNYAGTIISFNTFYCIDTFHFLDLYNHISARKKQRIKAQPVATGSQRRDL